MSSLSATGFSVTVRPGFICLAPKDTRAVLPRRAGSIVRWLAQKGYDLRSNRVLVADSRGIWDEFILAGSRYMGYRFLREPTIERAIAKAIAAADTRKRELAGDRP